MGPQPAPVLRLWPAGQQFVRHQRIEVSLAPPAAASPPTVEVILSRAQRAHYRLSWVERQVRNARGGSTPGVAMTLFGVPGEFAAFLGFSTV